MTARAPSPEPLLSAPEIKRLIKAACDGWRAAGLEVGSARIDPQTGVVTVLTPEAAKEANDSYGSWKGAA